MQPRRESRFSAKGRDLAKELEERFLGKVFGLCGVGRHAQTQRVHAPPVLVIERLERLGVPPLSPLDSLSFAKFGLRLPAWLGQIIFPGRTFWDAAVSSLRCIVCVTFV